MHYAIILEQHGKASQYLDNGVKCIHDQLCVSLFIQLFQSVLQCSSLLTIMASSFSPWSLWISALYTSLSIAEH